MNNARVMPVLLLIACAVHGTAGELRLRNGALIPGELKAVEPAHVVWKADLVGEIRVAKKDVQSLDSTTALALRVGTDAPPVRDCRVSASAAEAALECTGRETLAVSLAELRQAPLDRDDTGKITASIDLERGSNASQDTVDLDANATRRRGHLRHRADLSIDYEQDDTSTTEDEGELVYQGDRLLREGWYLFGTSEYHRDREAAIQESLFLGAGVGRDFEWHERLRFSLQAGAGEVRVNIVEEGTQFTEAGMIRWRGIWAVPWRGAELSHEGRYAVVFEDFGIHLIETQTSISMPIVGGWLAELRLDYDHYGITPEGESKDDIEWVLGLGYRW